MKIAIKTLVPIEIEYRGSEKGSGSSAIDES